MRCPKCRKELAFDAVEHAACGWKLASRTVELHGPPRPPPPKFAVSEKGLQALALMKTMLKKKVVRVEERKAAVPERHYGVEVTPGHGRLCTCEECWPKRMKRERVSAKIAALNAKLEALIKRDGLEATT